MVGKSVGQRVSEQVEKTFDFFFLSPFVYLCAPISFFLLLFLSPSFSSLLFSTFFSLFLSGSSPDHRLFPFLNSFIFFGGGGFLSFF